MKSWAVNILLVLSAGTAIYFFTVKFDTVTDAGRIKYGLDGMSKYLSFGSHIVFKCDAQVADEAPEYVSYYITPVKLVPPSPAGNDTTLLLEPATITDTGTIALLKRSSVIWQNKDDKFCYLLIRHL